MVYIISKSGRPLMPTKNHAKVRILLKQNKAKVVQTKPYFVIKLLYETTEYYQTLYLGWDLGSIHNGLAVADKKGNIYYKGQLILRGNLKQLSATRRGHRSFRRCKLWDRPKRFKLRRNSIRKDRYSPTMVMKHRQCMEMYKELSNVMPIKEENIIMETSQFDTHLLAHPEDTNRNGINYGFANSRAYVLHRDGYRCRHCGKSINNKLEVHHIVPKNNNGSDFHQNLITFCVDCHQDLHDGKWQLNQKGLARNYLAIQAAHMNTLASMMKKSLSKMQETKGYITKARRDVLDLPKEHWVDAAVIATQGKQPIIPKDLPLIITKAIQNNSRCLQQYRKKKKGLKCDVDMFYADEAKKKRIASNKKRYWKNPNYRNGISKMDRSKHHFRAGSKVIVCGKEFFILGRQDIRYKLCDVYGKQIDKKIINESYPVPYTAIKQARSSKRGVMQYALR